MVVWKLFAHSFKVYENISKNANVTTLLTKPAVTAASAVPQTASAPASSGAVLTPIINSVYGLSTGQTGTESPRSGTPPVIQGGIGKMLSKPSTALVEN